MKPTVPLMMFGFIPVVIILFRMLPPRRAAIASFLGAWMFLPNYTYGFPGMPDYDKVAAASIGVAIATCVFQAHRFSKLKFHFQDALVIVWCLTPAFASLANGLGAYDGFAASKNYLMAWGVPYLIGRLYFGDWEGFTDLAWGLFIAGLVYMPLCWIEMVMSPQLHNWIYGWHPHEFLQSLRGSSYRPVVFMNHGLMVGMWMTAASLAALALMGSGAFKTSSLARLLNRPRLFVALLVLTTVACRSMGALILLITTWGAIELAFKLKTRLPLHLMLSLPVLAITLKLAGLWSGQEMVELAARFSPERAASLEFRLINEELLVERALERPIFGWGGWGRSRVRNDDGEDVSVTDAYWVIVVGTTGIAGLASFASITLLPFFQLLRRIPVVGWKRPHFAAAITLGALLPAYFADCLFNDMKIPIYMLVAGGIVTILRVPLPSASGQLFPKTNSSTPFGTIWAAPAPATRPI